MGKFEDALRFVLSAEGGYTDNKNDRGGATNKGVTQAAYDKWRTAQMSPLSDVKWITDGEVALLYRDYYWEPAHCDILDAPVSTMHFDSAVQHGVGRAIRFLQEACGVYMDGRWGAITAGAALNMTHAQAKAYLDARRNFYDEIIQHDPSQAVFARGWTNRADQIQKILDENR